MSSARNPIVIASVVIALLCAGWAIYVTRHAGSSANPAMSGGMGMSGGAAATPPGRGAMPPGAGGPGGPPGGGPRQPGGGGRFGGMPATVVSRVVELQPVARELRALGTARANEAVEITAKNSNLVAAVRFRDGERVERGAVLVELDSAQARADLAAAEAALTESKSQYQRATELLPTQALSRSQFDQITATRAANAARVDAARARLEDTVIRAPFGGRVGLRRVSVGSLISPGTVITTLDDTSIIKVDFAVPENNLTALRAGLPVTVSSSVYPGRSFAGRVASIDSRIDADSRSILVRAELPNADGALKPGMFLNVELRREQRLAVVVPEEALVPEQNRQFVYVVADGKAEKREVRTGLRRPGSVEITNGLRAGERIVVEGTVKLRESGPVRDLATAARP
ncbi:MAG: efflux RND transporter periplasmic adaptor subunit [Gammaproteobacteria bacterium]|nr:efflux RND transporter periplasmic adaptor subunit [Gammaproteobacteria bacterium]